MDDLSSVEWTQVTCLPTRRASLGDGVVSHLRPTQQCHIVYVVGPGLILGASLVGIYELRLGVALAGFAMVQDSSCAEESGSSRASNEVYSCGIT